MTEKVRVCAGCREIVGANEDCADCRPSRMNSAACILILALWIAFLMVATAFAVGRIG